ncbi:hypothetical protein GHT06_009229 [Daphnia sinensis]|uniref:Uncharacterized protein n=1 Tax=Daphnia sinensis TaxID=1820382 RepID=A0AAD5L3P3_9CRUS|nr:hypothetical protein GHT06_009229 [Daphnia sinensis]
MDQKRKSGNRNSNWMRKKIMLSLHPQERKHIFRRRFQVLHSTGCRTRAQKGAKAEQHEEEEVRVDIAAQGSVSVSNGTDNERLPEERKPSTNETEDLIPSSDSVIGVKKQIRAGQLCFEPSSQIEGNNSKGKQPE